MLLVKTSLRHSPIHGFGVFAEEFIPAGTVVWRYVEGFDSRLSEEFVLSLPPEGQAAIRHYSAFWKGGYVVSADDARFLNHSESANLRTTAEPDEDIAVRDILPGEELTENYREFDERLHEKGIALGDSPGAGKEER